MDYIKVINNDGCEEIMEVVTIFNRSNSKYNYIIYKSLKTNEYFTGKYLGEDIVDLDVNLDYSEVEYANGIFSSLVGE